MKWETVAEFSFLFGVLVAAFLGTTNIANEQMYGILMMLGLIVGLANIFDVHLDKFLRATSFMLICTITFYVLATLSGNPMLMFLKNLSTAIALFIAPVVFVLAIMDIYEIAMDYGEKKLKAEKTARKKK